MLRRLFASRAVGEVISLDVRPPAVAGGKLRAITCDVRSPELGRHLGGCDALIHLAFVVTAYRPRAELHDINVGGSRNVFSAAAASGVKRIVYSSSVAAYGVVPGHPVPIVEETVRRHQPEFPYAAAKFEVEAFLDGFEAAHPELAIARLRPAILIGAHMEHALGDALRRRVLPDSGEVPLPIVWDEDVADAALLALTSGARGAFNLAADQPLSMAGLARAGGLRLIKIPRPVRLLAARLAPLLAQAKIGRATDPSWLESADVAMIQSSEKARRELGWRPRCPTAREVIARYLAEVPARVDPRIALFLKLVALFGRRGGAPLEARHLRARIHLQLTGPGGGDFALTLDEGRLTVAPGVPRPPSAVVTLRAATFLELLAGRADYTTCALAGRIRLEGEGLASMVFQGLIATFRGRVAAGGPAGLVTRHLERWFKNSNSGSKNGTAVQKADQEQERR